MTERVITVTCPICKNVIIPPSPIPAYPTGEIIIADRGTCVQFARDCLSRHDGGMVTNNMMQRSYSAFCDTLPGAPSPCSPSVLTRVLKQYRFHQYVARGQRVWRGVRVDLPQSAVLPPDPLGRD